MRFLAAALGILLILVVLWESFETVILPRRVTRRFRLTRFFYRNSWRAFQAAVGLFPARQRESLLSYFGPLSLLLLLSVWAVVIIIGFGLLHWADGSLQAGEARAGFFTDLYMSGTTFFTLGLGDVTPQSPFAKFLAVIECGMGLGFLALIISYLPALNQSFQRREVSISLLDARAGSPPCAVEILRRHNDEHGLEALRSLFHEWELWSAELLESHLSYPVLAYFRSQHDNQSWLAALTTILDASALVMAGIEGACERQAHRTFAMARHVLVDLAIVFYAPPIENENDRLSPEDLNLLRSTLAKAGINLHEGVGVNRELTELRRMYEPYVASLARYFRINVPPWMHASGHPDNWQISLWDTRSPRSRREPRHF